jgi:hypothetical protein
MLTITINGIDQTDKVLLRSFRVEQILTQEADSARFSLLAPTTAPEVMQEVVIMNGAEKVFAGVVMNVNLKYDSQQAIHDVVCKDYTELMDGKFVIEDFKNNTVAYILDFIKTHYMPAGFTINCEVDQTINYVKFNFLKPSQCLKKLAELVLGDWYVDYDKVVQFITKGTYQAPFTLSDSNNKFKSGTLQIKKDASQIKNVVFVRGGEYQGAIFTENITADGERATFNLAYKYANLSVELDTVAQTIGIDNITDPTTVDVLYNFAEKALKFPEENKPTTGQVLTISGNPYIPVYVKAEEIGSISKYGTKEHKIVDNNIKTKEAAIERASAELEAFNAEQNDGSFQTYEAGLRAGQLLEINSTILGVSENFVINKVSIQAESPTLMRYDVSLTTKEKFDLIRLLQQLLDRTEIGEDRTDEVLEKLYKMLEGFTIQELIVRTEPKAAPETMTIGETFRKDFPVEFVLTPYQIQDDDDPKRPFLLDRSLLI